MLLGSYYVLRFSWEPEKRRTCVTVQSHRATVYLFHRHLESVQFLGRRNPSIHMYSRHFTGVYATLKGVDATFTKSNRKVAAFWHFFASEIMGVTRNSHWLKILHTSIYWNHRPCFFCPACDLYGSFLWLSYAIHFGWYF